MSEKIISDHALNVVFRDARTFNSWEPENLSSVLMQAVYDLAKWGPTSANCSPARFVFVQSAEAKARLKPHLAQGNVAKTMSAPACVIIGHDLEFYDNLDRLAPHTDAKSWFVGNDALIEETAFRNGTLQGAYFMMAARALGLDCGPMSGFDQDGVNATFFAGTKVKSNFICNIGIGTAEGLHPRAPRLDFDEACQIL